MQGDYETFGERQWFLLWIETVREEPSRQVWLVEGAEPAVVPEALVDPVTDVAAGGLQGRIHQLIFAHGYDRIVAAMKGPNGRAAHGVRIFGGKRRGLMPAFRRIAPENSAGGDGDSRPPLGVGACDLPRAIAAQRK